MASCLNPFMRASTAAAPRALSAKMAKKRRPCHQDAAFVIPRKSAADALPHQHRNLRPFDDACAWIRQNRNTARRRVVLHGFMASLTSIQVACAPEITALLETMPSVNARRTTDCHLHEPFQTVTYKSVSFLGCNPTAQLPSPVALGGCDSVGWMLHPFSFRHGNMRELKLWNPVPQSA